MDCPYTIGEFIRKSLSWNKIHMTLSLILTLDSQFEIISIFSNSCF